MLVRGGCYGKRKDVKYHCVRRLHVGGVEMLLFWVIADSWVCA